MMATVIKLRGDTQAEWEASNPVLASREMGIETDTRRFKFGDGVTRWNNLLYAGSEAAALAELDAHIASTTTAHGGIVSDTDPRLTAPTAYYYTQVDLSSSWVINHNLGFRPNVTVEEAGTGLVIMASEIHHSVAQLELQFNTPRAGTARLS